MNEENKNKNKNKLLQWYYKFFFRLNFAREYFVVREYSLYIWKYNLSA